MGQPEYGAPAALVEPVVRWGLQAIPVVPIFVNVHRRPAPNGRRCYELGAALSAILEEAEVRLWAVAAGAGESLGAKAHVVDYFPCHAVGAGVGFACWEAGHRGA